MFYKLERKQRATVTRYKHTVSAVSKTKTDSNNTHKGGSPKGRNHGFNHKIHRNATQKHN